MTEHWFYHLEGATVEAVLPDLLEKTLQRSWTALVKTNADKLADLDSYLWTYRDDSFLPHGREDEPLADQQPIRLSATATSADGADVVLITDGSEVDDMTGVTRCIFMINGRSETAVKEARARWTRLKNAGATITYYQQNDRGQWAKKA